MWVDNIGRAFSLVWKAAGGAREYDTYGNGMATPRLDSRAIRAG